MFMAIFCFFSLSGCDTGKGNEFIGDWRQVTENKFPSELIIRSEEGVYFIDNKYFDLDVAESKQNQELIDYMTGKIKDMPSRESSFGEDSYRVRKMDAVAVSNSVLKGDGFSLRLEGDKLMFNNEVYVKK